MGTWLPSGKNNLRKMKDLVQWSKKYQKPQNNTISVGSPQAVFENSNFQK